MLVERKANITDLGFINGCIIYGARKGHYAFNAENPEIVTLMKKEMQAVVVRNELLDKRRAVATIFTLNNKRIGLLILSDAFLDGSGIEIYAMSIANKHQRQGYGSQLIDNLLNYYVYQDIYARCSPTSQKMAQLLFSRGFRLDMKNEDYKVLMREGMDSSDFGKPLYMRF